VSAAVSGVLLSIEPGLLVWAVHLAGIMHNDRRNILMIVFSYRLCFYVANGGIANSMATKIMN